MYSRWSNIKESLLFLNQKALACKGALVFLSVNFGGPRIACYSHETYFDHLKVVFWPPQVSNWPLCELQCESTTRYRQAKFHPKSEQIYISFLKLWPGQGFPLYFNVFPCTWNVFLCICDVFLCICIFSSEFATFPLNLQCFTLYLQFLLCICNVSSGFNQFSANVPPSGKIHYCDMAQHAIILIIVLIILILIIIIIITIVIIAAEKSVSVTYPPRLADLLENSRHRIHKKSSTISDTTNNHPITKIESNIHIYILMK